MESVWDSQLVAQVAFNPRRCPPSSKRSTRGGGWVDDTLTIAQGVQLAYRLYTATSLSDFSTDREAKARVLVHFHANAELCTDLHVRVGDFYNAGYNIILAPEFRGYAWSTGTASLRRLCPDAEEFHKAIPSILQKEGLQDFAAVDALVVHGRSLGAACAIHLAHMEGSMFNALIVESGCLSLKDLPMLHQMGRMMPDVLKVLLAQPDPLRSMAKLRKVQMPTLFLHGELDKVVPVQQAIDGYEVCAAEPRMLLTCPRSGHNDLHHRAGEAFFAEPLRQVLQLATGVEPTGSMPFAGRRRFGEEALAPSLSSIGKMLTTVVRCLPGMQRCMPQADPEPGG